MGILTGVAEGGVRCVLGCDTLRDGVLLFVVYMEGVRGEGGQRLGRRNEQL